MFELIFANLRETGNDVTEVHCIFSFCVNASSSPDHDLIDVFLDKLFVYREFVPAITSAKKRWSFFRFSI